MWRRMCGRIGGVWCEGSEGFNYSFNLDGIGSKEMAGGRT